jgi:hypothetical protein
MKFISDSLLIRYDDELKSIVIAHLDRTRFPHPFVQIREETYASMNLTELSEFVGSRILLLMPTMRDHFKDEIDRLADSDTGRGMRGDSNS